MSSSREKRPKLSRFKMHRSKARAAEKIGWWNSHLSVIAHSPRRKNNDLCRRRQCRFAESHAVGGEIFVGIILDEHVEEVRAFSVVHRDRDLWLSCCSTSRAVSGGIVNVPPIGIIAMSTLPKALICSSVSLWLRSPR